MTHRYIGTKEIVAWKADKDGKPGYGVKYADGYTSWSPADAFEDAYRTSEPGMEQALNFGDALHYLKLGKKVSRTGWNGKGMFVYLVPPASYPVQTGAAKAHFGEGSMVPYNAYLAIKNVDETVSTWVPSVNDCLAGDWSVIGEATKLGADLPPHQQRVLDEARELTERLSKLDAFILDNPVYLGLPVSERDRLSKQSKAMATYAGILNERIAQF